MTFLSCPDRDRILAADGHLLVTGGPGCGKTTIALRKALVRIGARLLPEQRVLFLSFSRAAVARIVQAARKDLPKESRRLLDIQTFHSFCWRIVRGHGYLLGAVTPLHLLPPHDERAMRNGAKTDDPSWAAERERLFLEEGRVAFDLFAPTVLSLLQRSAAHRKLIADRYPLIIVDEAQDTGADQWACMEAIADLVQLVCLADLDQQIYDFRPDVSPERLTQIVLALTPLKVDLGAQNIRSPGAEIVKFGNDILAEKPRGSAYIGVSQSAFSPTAAMRDRAIRSAVGMLRKKIINATTGAPPQSIGYLTNWGKGVTIIARALQGGDGIKEIPHRVVVDEAEVLLATRVAALCLEPVEDIWAAISTGLDMIAELYRARGNMTKVEQLRRYATNARERNVRGNAKCPRVLKDIIEHLKTNPLSGNPVQDWLTIRRTFETSNVAELKFVASRVNHLMTFNRGRRISDSLAQVWLQLGQYDAARNLIETAIAADQIMGSDGDLSGINVMTMHKSKGKEFDGVIILHLGNNISPLSPEKEPAPHKKSRRLLRVGITRAKQHVLMLTDASTRSPLLEGHNLNLVTK